MVENIKNPDTERLVRVLVDRTGESVTGAITVAVRERLERLSARDRALSDARRRRLLEIARTTGQLWAEPYRSMDLDELLYDEVGLPR